MYQGSLAAKNDVLPVGNPAPAGPSKLSGGTDGKKSPQAP
jgi:hypothetical protein